MFKEKNTITEKPFKVIAKEGKIIVSGKKFHKEIPALLFGEKETFNLLKIVDKVNTNFEY